MVPGAQGCHPQPRETARTLPGDAREGPTQASVVRPQAARLPRDIPSSGATEACGCASHPPRRQARPEGCRAATPIGNFYPAHSFFARFRLPCSRVFYGLRFGRVIAFASQDVPIYELGSIRRTVETIHWQSKGAMGQAYGQRPYSDPGEARSACRQDPGALRYHQGRGAPTA